ncbi:hypothetical protein ACIREM_27970 [Streptomyces shenzhenensis]|uniref:hypothetical protein n=1 Tax=Streptomyces shenzhenensis TaxID=943815 RepID=UPI00382589E4
MTQYQTASTNARLKLFALLKAGVPAADADDLVAALEAGAATRAQCGVAGLDGMAPASRGEAFEDGWDAGEQGRERGPAAHRGPGLGAAWWLVGPGC